MTAPATNTKTRFFRNGFKILEKLIKIRMLDRNIRIFIFFKETNCHILLFSVVFTTITFASRLFFDLFVPH
jgi:hypothetical protein